MTTHRTIKERLLRYSQLVWPACVMVLVAGAVALSSGCAVLAGGAAGAATGYVA